MLSQSSPLKCNTPADVYLLLKSSDFVAHDLDPRLVWDECGYIDARGNLPAYELELVLKKWYPIETSREMRCFVLENILIGLT
jgi:hypothetical protein